MSQLPALYEIASQYQDLLNMDLPAEQVADTLELIEGDFKEKAKHVGFVIESMNTNEEALKLHLKDVQARLTAISNKRDSLKAYLKHNMEATGITKIDCPYFGISLQNNPEAVEISDETLIPDTYKQEVVTVKIDKAGLKTALKAGATIPGCALTRGTHVRIR